MQMNIHTYLLFVDTPFCLDILFFKFPFNKNQSSFYLFIQCSSFLLVKIYFILFCIYSNLIAHFYLIRNLAHTQPFFKPMTLAQFKPAPRTSKLYCTSSLQTLQFTPSCILCLVIIAHRQHSHITIPISSRKSLTINRFLFPLILASEKCANRIHKYSQTFHLPHLQHHTTITHITLTVYTPKISFKFKKENHVKSRPFNSIDPNHTICI